MAATRFRGLLKSSLKVAPYLAGQQRNSHIWYPDAKIERDFKASARMHANYVCPGDIASDLPSGLCGDIHDCARQVNLPTPGTQLGLKSKRFGLVGLKIGMMPQWTVKGERVLCSVIEIQDSEVVSVVDPNTWYKNSHVGKRKAYGRYGSMYKVTVGAKNISSSSLKSESQAFFQKWGVHPKEYLGSFLTTADALVPPGTKLDARHFAVGQYVNVSGRTIDWGFQGGVHRWGFHGMPARGTTKSHRRVGSVGSTGDARVWPGKRMPGHMGYRWRQITGLEVLRINPIENIIIIKGNVPGDNGYPVLLNDCMKADKKFMGVPFPTFLPTIEEEPAEELMAPHIFNFDSPSIIFTEDDATKSAARDKMRAKIAKVKK